MAMECSRGPWGGKSCADRGRGLRKRKPRDRPRGHRAGAFVQMCVLLCGSHPLFVPARPCFRRHTAMPDMTEVLSTLPETPRDRLGLLMRRVALVALPAILAACASKPLPPAPA